MASPGKWVHVETDAGHILRLVGANGEEIMRSSEVLSDRRIRNRRAFKLHD
jgi:hypothetical protein